MVIIFSSIEIGNTIALQVPSEPIRENSRRVSRSATMDGGCVITDSGYSDSDRKFSFAATNLNQIDSNRLWDFFETESMVYMSGPEGFFSGYIESLTIEGDVATVSFLVKEKIT